MRNSIFNNLKIERDYSASTGLTKLQFCELATGFCELYQVTKNEFPENFGNDPAFPDGEELLFMLLYYKKTNITFDLLALSFGVARSTAYNYIQLAKSILQTLLKQKNLLPKRYFKDEEELQTFFKNVPELMIDAVERQMQRPSNQELQEEAYSGKKKFCAFKNTVITSRNKYIYFLSKTVLSGKIHDFNLFKLDFISFKNAFNGHTLWVDLGYLGIKDIWNSSSINIPYKLPKKSKNNPAPSLTTEEKEYNKYVSKNRVVVENAIAGLKRYNILVSKFRNKTIQFADEMIELSAGLWNLKLTNRLNSKA